MKKSIKNYFFYLFCLHKYCVESFINNQDKKWFIYKLSLYSFQKSSKLRCLSTLPINGSFSAYALKPALLRSQQRICLPDEL